MERNALLLYLRDVLDLEIAKNKIQSLYNHDRMIYESKYDSLNDVKYENLPEKEDSHIGITIFLLIGTILFLWLGSFGGFILKFFGIWCAIVVLFLIIGNIVSKIRYKKKKAAVISCNSDLKIQHDKNLKEIVFLQSEWKKKNDFYNSEYQKVNRILESYYSQNILANQYRNLASVYYIYDYMSSSHESLKDTLIHEHMENGIQRILSKLDRIIDQNSEMIFLQRRNEASNQKIITQNRNMLSSLQQIEQNSYDTIQYARLSANYNEANAYFSLATYLVNS